MVVLPLDGGSPVVKSMEMLDRWVVEGETADEAGPSGPEMRPYFGRMLDTLPHTLLPPFPWLATKTAA